MINWLYAIIIILLNGSICSSKFERSTAPLAPPGYAPSNGG